MSYGRSNLTVLLAVACLNWLLPSCNAVCKGRAGISHLASRTAVQHHYKGNRITPTFIGDHRQVNLRLHATECNRNGLENEIWPRGSGNGDVSDTDGSEHALLEREIEAAFNNDDIPGEKQGVYQDGKPHIDASDPNNDWYERELIDRCKIMAVAGRGGNGCVSFRREKHVPLGGADGGNGGPGGSVYLVCDETISNLNRLKQFYVYKAEDGKHGRGDRQNGAKGSHRYIPVPPGTHVHSVQGHLHAVLEKHGDRLMVVRGGRGGKGNRYFKTKFNVAPKICELGEKGKQREIVLNFKIVGNVALIGKPNSGKSSLLRCLSNARPRVADYAFSTKFPVVGVLEIDKKESEISHDNDDGQGNQAAIPQDTEAVSESADIPYSETLGDGTASEHDAWSSDLVSEEEITDAHKKGCLYTYGFREVPQLSARATGPGVLYLSDKISGTKGTFNYTKRMDCSSTDSVGNSESEIDASSDEEVEDIDDDYEDDDSDEMWDTNSFETLADIYHTEYVEPQPDAKRRLVIADVPGLIEGASSGRGLGHKFLKHIENSNVLAYVIDSSLEEPFSDFLDVKHEVGLYNQDILSRLELVLLNKVDLIAQERAAELLEQFKAECKHNRVYVLSAKTRSNIEQVKETFSHIYQDPIDNGTQTREPFDISIDDPDDFRKLNPRKFQVKKIREGEFRIISQWLERKVPMMRFEQRETLDKLRRILKTNRIHHKLRRLGVKQGDVVHIGESSFCVNELAY